VEEILPRAAALELGLAHARAWARPSFWPTRAGNEHARDRAHWCHGAPGAILLFARAHEVLGGEGGGGYLPAALRVGEAVWARGLLRKGPGACRGVAGNA
jgi:hypothetical protein